MARINIDDEFFDDVAAVAVKMGDLDRAHGQAIRLIRWAQLQTKERKPTTLDEFCRKGFSQFLSPEFVTIDGDMVKVRGADNHFAWLKQKADAGRAGAAKTNEKRWGDQQKSAKVSKRRQTSPSSSSSSSSSISESSSSLIPSESTVGGVDVFIAAYCRRFKTRWGVNPPIQGKDQGIAKRLAKGMSSDRQALILDAYFAMPDAWVVKGKHTLGMLEMKLNEVVVFADSGQFHTQRQVREADSSATNAILLEKVRKGEL